VTVGKVRKANTQHQVNMVLNILHWQKTLGYLIGYNGLEFIGCNTVGTSKVVAVAPPLTIRAKISLAPLASSKNSCPSTKNTSFPKTFVGVLNVYSFMGFKTIFHPSLKKIQLLSVPLCWESTANYYGLLNHMASVHIHHITQHHMRINFANRKGDVTSSSYLYFSALFDPPNLVRRQVPPVFSPNFTTIAFGTMFSGALRRCFIFNHNAMSFFPCCASEIFSSSYQAEAPTLNFYATNLTLQSSRIHTYSRNRSTSVTQSRKASI
jgi:hypothetical protein